MLIVPIQAVPNQALVTTLNNQSCQINVYQTAFGLFLDLYVNNSIIIAGVLCQNLNLIVRNIYLGFIGDLCFNDTQIPLSPVNNVNYPLGSDPIYTGLGTRFQLLYLFPTDPITFVVNFPVP